MDKLCNIKILMKQTQFQERKLKIHFTCHNTLTFFCLMYLCFIFTYCWYRLFKSKFRDVDSHSTIKLFLLWMLYTSLLFITLGRKSVGELWTFKFS